MTDTTFNGWANYETWNASCTSTTMNRCTVSLLPTLSRHDASGRQSSSIPHPCPRVQLRADDPRWCPLDGWTDRHRRDGRDVGRTRRSGRIHTTQTNTMPTADFAVQPASFGTWVVRATDINHAYDLARALGKTPSSAMPTPGQPHGMGTC